VLRHRQRIHVRTQADRTLALALLAVQHAHQARFPDAAMNLDAPLFQLLRDDIRSARFLERQLGMGVDVTAHGDQALVLAFDFGDQAHGRFSSFRWHALAWPLSSIRSKGISCWQRGIAWGQRGWKLQPVGGRSGEGNSPLMGW
jgi:hypothetical protein